jgi:hypothetical protein
MLIKPLNHLHFLIKYSKMFDYSIQGLIHLKQYLYLQLLPLKFFSSLKFNEKKNR